MVPRFQRQLDGCKLPVRLGYAYRRHLPGRVLPNHRDVHRSCDSICRVYNLHEVRPRVLTIQFTLIAHDNPYALVTLATLHSIPIAYIILFTTFPGVGTVAYVCIRPFKAHDLGVSPFHLSSS